MNNVVISTHIETELAAAISCVNHDRLFVLTDETTHRLCWPLIASFDCVRPATMIEIGATDANKTLETLATVWTALQQGGATRHSLLINLGGGMVTDLGGFAASTFKRGISYINIPTTLLSMVDASVGGKTGINFGGLKNEIGVFNAADTVIIDTLFLRTLDKENILSGYAEMLKHGLLDENQNDNDNDNDNENENQSEFVSRGFPARNNDSVSRGFPARKKLHPLAQLLNFEPVGMTEDEMQTLGEMVGTSVAVKERVVEADPYEKGIRKALNLGHTFGHAFESLALTRRPVLHGYAVAWGLVCELYLSCVKTAFPTHTMRQCVHFIKEHYGQPDITCDDYPTLLRLMQHDKKNTAGSINFTLLSAVGDIRIDQTATQEEIYDALDFLREG